MTIEFFMPMIPPTVTAQQHRVVARKGKKAAFYDTPELAEARSKFLSGLAPHRPCAPMTGALRLCVKWCYPVTPSHYDGEYKTTKPDTDNVQKLLKDCMTKVGFWRDDCLVACEITEKFYANTTGIYVRVEDIEQP